MEKVRIGIEILVSSIMLALAACSQVTPPTATQTPIPPTRTVAPPTATAEPSPTLRPEKLISQNKPARVSAAWVMEPPERAVNGNMNDWWGAGGPAPQWIEIDLQGLYAISRVRVINQGPTGNAPYQVIGRGSDHKNQLLHVFDGHKYENQTLEITPKTAWEDISTIRVEILNGSGWVGFREVQVYSRQEPKSWPVSAVPPTALFSAHVQAEELEVITAENAILMNPLAILGRGSINHLAWSMDGEQLAAAGTLGVWLYNPADLNKPPQLLEGHSRDVLTVAFSQDGMKILSGSQDGTVKHWEAATGKLKRTISLWDDFSYEIGDQKREREVWNITISPDGRLLAEISLDGTLRVWNLVSKAEIIALEGVPFFFTGLAFSPDSSLLVYSGYDGSIDVLDVKIGSLRETFSGHTGRVLGLAFSPDGKTLSTGGSDMSIRLWDVLSGNELSFLDGHTAEVLSLVFSPDGRTLASSSVDGTLRLWDVETRGERLLIDQVYGVTKLAFSPDRAMLASNGYNVDLRLWDTETGDRIDTLDVQTVHTNAVTSIAFNPDSKLLAAGSEDGVVRMWELETNKIHATLLGHEAGVTGVAFSPDGKLLASSSFDGTVSLWNGETGMPIDIFQGHGSYVRCVAFSPDSRTVASGGTDKTVRLWDVATGEERLVLTGHTGEVESVAFSPDGAWLVSASADKTLRIWEVANGEEKGVLQGHESFALSAAFDPGGGKLASGGGDHSLRVWDLEFSEEVVSGRNRFPPIGHGGWVLSVAFSPDGEIVARGGVSTTSFWVAPGEIQLFSADTGFPYARLMGHTQRVTSIVFSPDGKLLASGSGDGSIRLWGVQD
jgi:WD40 repeat protein